MTSDDKFLKDTQAIVAEIELPIKASKTEVWKALTDDIGKWWPKGFYASQKPAEFKVDLKLGGFMYEDTGNSAGLVWFTILGIDPEEMLYVIGHTAPPFGGPATGLVTFTLKSSEDNITVFKVADASFGVVTEETIKQAQDGWTMIFTPMKEYLEQGR